MRVASTEILKESVFEYHQFQVACPHERKTGNKTDQSKSPYPMTSSILIGQFDFPFYVHETTNLQSTNTDS